MKSGAVWIASFAALLIAGAPAVRGLRNLSLVTRAVLGAAVASVVLSTWMTLFSLVGLLWNVPVLLLVTLIASIGLGRPLEAGPDPAAKRPSSLTGADRWLWTGAVLLSAAGVAVAALSVIAGASTSGDFIMFWGPKAQVFALTRTIDASIFRDPSLGYLHPSYPPLVTNLYAFATMLAGRMAWGAATATFPLLLAALALALPGLLRGTAAEPTASAAAALVVSGIGLVGMEADIAGNGEMPLLLFETLAMALLVRRDAAKPSMQLLAGILLAGTASTKIEGLPFVIATALLFPALRRDVPDKLRAALRLFLPTAVTLGAWFAFGARSGLFRGYEGYGRFLTIYPAIFPRVAASVGYFLWGIGYATPFLFPLVFLALRPRPWRPALLPLGIGATLCAFFLFTYLHDQSPHMWIGWSAARIFSPLIPLLAIAGCAGTADSAPEATGPGRAAR
jgi:hypothetical protein